MGAGVVEAIIGLTPLISRVRGLGIPEKFYCYWNDVVNAVGYTPKLLLMCAAIGCLTRIRLGKKDWEKVVQVLGRELKEDLYGTEEDSSTGLRHRLAHGEYLGQSRASATAARSDPRGGQVAARGRGGASAVLRGAHERPGAGHVLFSVNGNPKVPTCGN